MSTRSSRNDYTCQADDTRLWYQRNFDPNDVMQHLGKIVLIGQKVQYLNRVRIIADKDGHQTNPGPTVSGTLQDVANADAQKDAPIKGSITGSNLADARVVSDDSAITIKGYLPKSDGSGIDFTFTAKDAAAKPINPYRLRVVTPNGEAPIYLNIAPPAPAAIPALKK